MRPLPLLAVLVALAGCGGGGGGGGGGGPVDTGGGSGTPGNRPPELAPMPAQTVTEGRRLILAPSATDPDGDPVSFTYSGWSIAGSRIATAPGAYTVTITASDGRGGTDRIAVPVTVLPETNPRRVAWDPASADRDAVPFPSDQFTVADPAMATGRRVALAMPADPFLAADTAAINAGDGFALFPRITVPLLGAAPDPGACTADAAFLIRLDAPGCGAAEIVELDRRIAEASSRRLIAAPAQLLQAGGRYALVVTDALTAGGGQPIARQPAMNALLHAWERGDAPADPFTAACFAALDALPSGRVPAIDHVLAVTPLTVRTVHTLPAKLRAAVQTVALPEPTLETSADHAGDESFPVGAVTAIEAWLHRASRPAAGSTIAFPAGSLTTSGADADIAGEVWLERVASGARLQVPANRITAIGGVLATDISALGATVGDEIALLACQRPLGSGGIGERRPWQWGTRAGRIAVGRFRAPVYTATDGLVPVIATGPGATPAQRGVADHVFVLVVPAGPAPAGGWPVTHFFHGGGAYGWDPSFFNVAATLAGKGVATIAFTAGGHGGGPRSRLVLQTTGGAVVVTGSGRSVDLDGDGAYGGSEGLCLPQRLADAAALVRALQQHGIATGAGALAIDATRTGATGISFGGHTSFCLAALEPRIGACAPDVPGWGHLSWGHLRREGALRALTAQELQRRGLLNAGAPTAPLFGFDEAVPLPGQTAPSTLPTGAEAIQRALDHLAWTDPDGSLIGLAPRVADGALRGAPAPVQILIHRADRYAINPIQALVLQAGGLRPQAAGLRLEQEPAADAALASLGFDPGLARHILLAVPWSGLDGDVLGRIAELGREQQARFIASQGTERWDPDGDGALFAGDVFTVPPDTAELALWLADSGL